MQKALNISIRFTLVTTLLLGIVYPLAVTAFAHLALRDKADGQLIYKNGQLIGSKIIGQSFTSDKYFHSRPSAAGNGSLVHFERKYTATQPRTRDLFREIPARRYSGTVEARPCGLRKRGRISDVTGSREKLGPWQQ